MTGEGRARERVQFHLRSLLCRALSKPFELGKDLAVLHRIQGAFNLASCRQLKALMKEERQLEASCVMRAVPTALKLRTPRSAMALSRVVALTSTWQIIPMRSVLRIVIDRARVLLHSCEAPATMRPEGDSADRAPRSSARNRSARVPGSRCSHGS